MIDFEKLEDGYRKSPTDILPDIKGLEDKLRLGSALLLSVLVGNIPARGDAIDRTLAKHDSLVMTMERMISLAQDLGLLPSGYHHGIRTSAELRDQATVASNKPEA